MIFLLSLLVPWETFISILIFLHFFYFVLFSSYQPVRDRRTGKTSRPNAGYMQIIERPHKKG